MEVLITNTNMSAEFETTNTLNMKQYLINELLSLMSNQN